MKKMLKQAIPEIVTGVAVAGITGLGGFLYAYYNNLSAYSYQFSLLRLCLISGGSAVAASATTYLFFRSRLIEGDLDQLTRTLNSGQIDKHLRQQIDDAKDNNQNFAVILLDIDNFKSINDTYIHEIGNETLRKVAELIRPRTAGEFIFRYGGDEFLLISKTGMDARWAYGFANRLRQEIAKHEFDGLTNSGKTFLITASCGVVLASGDDTIRSIRERVALALKQSKHPRPDCPQGKNFTFLWEDGPGNHSSRSPS